MHELGGEKSPAVIGGAARWVEAGRNTEQFQTEAGSEAQNSTLESLETWRTSRLKSAKMGRESVSVFVGNLSDHARNEDIDRFFKGYGKLKDVSLKGGYGKKQGFKNL